MRLTIRTIANTSSATEDAVRTTWALGWRNLGATLAKNRTIAKRTATRTKAADADDAVEASARRSSARSESAIGCDRSGSTYASRSIGVPAGIASGTASTVTSCAAKPGALRDL